MDAHIYIQYIFLLIMILLGGITLRKLFEKDIPIQSLSRNYFFTGLLMLSLIVLGVFWYLATRSVGFIKGFEMLHIHGTADDMILWRGIEELFSNLLIILKISVFQFLVFLIYLFVGNARLKRLEKVT